MSADSLYDEKESGFVGKMLKGQLVDESIQIVTIADGDNTHFMTNVNERSISKL